MLSSRRTNYDQNNYELWLHLKIADFSNPRRENQFYILIHTVFKALDNIGRNNPKSKAFMPNHKFGDYKHDTDLNLFHQQWQLSSKLIILSYIFLISSRKTLANSLRIVFLYLSQNLKLFPTVIRFFAMTFRAFLITSRSKERRIQLLIYILCALSHWLKYSKEWLRTNFARASILCPLLKM